MMELAGKTAFITGGASGLGLAMARAFASAGMKVAITDVEQASMDRVADEFSDSNSVVMVIKADVSNREDMDRAAQQAFDRLGNVHILCNNAGVAVSKNVAEMTQQDWDWVMGVDLDGVINGVQLFVPHMIAHGEGGHVVNTASIAGLIGVPNLVAYNAAKFAVVGISESMRQDLAAHGVSVSVLCPGLVNTGIFKSERNRPDSLGGAASSELSDEEREAMRKASGLDNAQMVEPDLIGEMVLHAVRNQIFYIVSHKEFQPVVEARYKEINSAFDLWAEFKAAQVSASMH